MLMGLIRWGGSLVAGRSGILGGRAWWGAVHLGRACILGGCSSCSSWEAVRLVTLPPVGPPRTAICTVHAYLTHPQSPSLFFLCAPPCSIWNSTFLGRSSVAVLPYCQALSKFPSHIQQVSIGEGGGWLEVYCSWQQGCCSGPHACCAWFLGHPCGILTKTRKLQRKGMLSWVASRRPCGCPPTRPSCFCHPFQSHCHPFNPPSTLSNPPPPNRWPWSQSASRCPLTASHCPSRWAVTGPG